MPRHPYLQLFHNIARGFVLLLVGLALASASVPVLSADRALVIGIDAYRQDPRIPSLQGAVNDARAIERFLREQAGYRPEDIRLLLDAQATRAGIIASIEEWLIRGTRPGDRAFLHFSGHGAQVPALNPADVHDQVLLPFDARADALGVMQDFLRDKELAALLDRLIDRKVTVVVDACHSGAITRQVGGPDLDGMVRTPLALAAVQNLTPRVARSGSESTPALLPSTPNRTVWTAVSSHQLAFEDIERSPRAGFFTNRFIKGIAQGYADLDGDGRVSHLELHRWLGAESASYCQRLGAKCQLGITPTLEIARALQIAPVQDTLVGGEVPAPAVHEVATAALVVPVPIRPNVESGPVVPAVDPVPITAFPTAGVSTVGVPSAGSEPTSSEPSPIVATPHPGSMVLPPTATPPDSSSEPIGNVTEVPGAAQAVAALATPAPDPDSVFLEILPHDRPRIGEFVRFRVTSPFDGHLLVLNIDPEGRLIQLFPNRFSERQGKAARIERSRPITIPDATYGFEFSVTGPLGAGRVLALVTVDPVDFSDLADPVRALEVVPAGTEVDHLLRIAERLRATWTTEGLVQRPLQWSVAQQHYQTMP